MREFIKGWWHVATACAAGTWLIGSMIFGWVGDVNASMVTTKELVQTTVRKDVLNETMKRIESELRSLNDKFDRAYPAQESNDE